MNCLEVATEAVMANSVSCRHCDVVGFSFEHRSRLFKLLDTIYCMLSWYAAKLWLFSI